MNTIQPQFGTVGTVGTNCPYNWPSPHAQSPRWGDSVPTLPTLPTLAATLVEDCNSLGIELWAEGDRIRYRGPAGTINPEIVDALRTHKAALLALLTTPDPFAERWGPALDDDEPAIHTRRRLTDPALAWGDSTP